MGGGEEGQEFLSSFDLGSRGAVPQVSQLPSGRAGTRGPAPGSQSLPGLATFVALLVAPAPSAVGLLSEVAGRTPAVAGRGLAATVIQRGREAGLWPWRLGVGIWGAGSLSWEPGLGLRLLLVDQDGMSWQGGSLGGEGRAMGRGWGAASGGFGAGVGVPAPLAWHLRLSSQRPGRSGRLRGVAGHI